MASKSLFLSSIKEDMKRRTLSIILSVIVEFLLFPVAALFYFQSYSDKNRVITLYFIKEFLKGGVLMVAICGAIICAYSGFAYLFNKKAVDLYHGIPINRKKSFAIRYLNGFLVYIVPLFVFLFLSLPVYFANIDVNNEIIKALFTVVLYGILAFLIIYNLVILGIMLSGNASNAGFLSLFIGVYAVIVGGLLDNYFALFLNTYRHGDLRLHSITKWFSPILYISDIFGKGRIFPSILLILAMLLLSYFLFVHRKMEKAGMGGIYPKVTVVVRFCVTLLAGMGLGLIFSISSRVSLTAWLLFGILFGGIVAHILMNAMFNMSIKSALKGKAFLGAALVTSVLLSLGIRYDCFGYDNYLPAKSEVEAVSITIRRIGNYPFPLTGQFCSLSKTEEFRELGEIRIEDLEELKSWIPVTDENDLGYRLALLSKEGNYEYQATVSKDKYLVPAYPDGHDSSELVYNGKEIVTVETAVVDGTEETTTLIPTETEVFDVENRVIEADVEFRLKNGGKAIRHYTFYRTAQFIDVLLKLYNSEEFKKAMLSANAGDKSEHLQTVILPKGWGMQFYRPGGKEALQKTDSLDVMYENSDLLMLNKTAALELYKAYQADVADSTLNEVLHGDIIGELRFVYDNGNKTEIYQANLSPFYARTLALLKKYGSVKSDEANLWQGDVSLVKAIHIYDRAGIEIKKDYDMDSAGDKSIFVLHQQSEMQDVFQKLRDSYKTKEEVVKFGRYFLRVELLNGDWIEKYVVAGSELEKMILELNK